jgi:hypothetical protein
MTASPAAGIKSYPVRESPRLPPRPQLSDGENLPGGLQAPILPSRSPMPPSSPGLASASVERRSVGAAASALENGAKSAPSFRASPIPPSSAQIPSSPGRRAAPPVPSRKVSSNFTPNETERSTTKSSASPAITPSSTGDYVVVPSPPVVPASPAQAVATTASKPAPPLPPRAVPQPRKTLDMNGSPPPDLASPVVPDVVKSTALPTKKARPVVASKPANLRSTSTSGHAP